MLPILTMSNIDSHESFFKNQFFGVSSSVESVPLNENVRVLTIGVIVFEVENKAVIESALSRFVRYNNLDNGTEYDSFILEESKFGFMLHHCAVDLDFNLGLLNDFFIDLIDELNSLD